MPKRGSDGSVSADLGTTAEAPDAGGGAAAAAAAEPADASPPAAGDGGLPNAGGGAASSAGSAGRSGGDDSAASAGAAPERDGHVMRRIRLEKIVLNMGVGQSGPAVEAAKKALEQISGCRPCPRSARDTQRDFGVRKGEPIGMAVTVRGEPAGALAARLFEAKGNSLAGRSFDDFGNFSFGIREHIDIPGVKYDPSVGIIGLDVCMSLSRPGYGIRKRSKHKARVGRSHRITADEARRFVAGRFGIEVAA